MPRPFLNLSVIQLEEEFDRARMSADKAKLQRLLHELDFRESRRARKLKERVVQAIGVVSEPVAAIESPIVAPALASFAPSMPSTSQAVAKFQTLPSDLPPPRPPDLREPRCAPNSNSSGQAFAPPKPLSSREATALLSAWTALEVLSPPQTFTNPQGLGNGVGTAAVSICDAELPWERGARARPNTRIFYHVVLGAIAMPEATARLLQIFSDTDIERVAARGFAPIAMLTVDSKGVPVAPQAIAISSFAWGLPIALAKQLSTLSGWAQVEDSLIAGADKVVRRFDEDDQPLAVDRATIDGLYKHLLERLSLPPELTVVPEFALRVFHWFRAPDPPEPPPMGSFFLGDLAKAKSVLDSGNVPAALAQYLGLRLPSKRIDLRDNDAALADAVAPNLTPAGRWPSVGGHPLVVLQQAAVNLAAGGQLAMLPVNGPPGTGKTTLLRDVVVATVVARARALSKFKDPATAFAPSDASFQQGGNVLHHYPLDSSLRGFELLVASSNNKAVENVSAELPSLDAIDKSRTDLRYFKTVADSVASGLKQGKQHDEGDGGRFEGTADDSESWGLIAAVLGNAANKVAFRKTAWTDEENGLRTYLMEASGHPQIIKVTDPATGRIVESRKPRVVLLERPPKNAHEARSRWDAACKKFKNAADRVDRRLATMEKGRQSLAGDVLNSQLEQAGANVRAAQAALEKLHQLEGAAASKVPLLTQARDAARAALAAHDANRPGFLARFLGSAKESNWAEHRIGFAKALSDASNRLDEVLRAADTVRKEKQDQLSQLASRQRVATEACAAVDAMAQNIQEAVRLSGSRFGDAAFFDREPEDLHRDTVWQDDETQRLREEVFVAAIELHRAFVDGAAKQVRNNLEILFQTFFGRSAWSPKKRPLMANLWSTFFCVVPVVSTTFASVERMLGMLDAESLGLLLIDEAGQAVPQAAVGALMRARRAIVVGDPIQLPPVTSLPTELSDQIAKEFGVDSQRLTAPSASVQTLCDIASPVGTTIDTDGNKVWVGVPLVVHRRCAEPMFSLSNNMAYGGMMVQGRGARPSAIRDVVGPSAWIDVRPERCIDKWSEAEGDAVLEMLHQLDQAGLTDPDLYLISPFRIVAQKLRELLLKERVLSRWTSNPRQWVSERVGTVYTVQGREADTVLLVLGAAEPLQKGARSWAGQGVNQLNVAVTRAKENLYVFGNRFEWASAGKFAHLETMLPT